MPFTITPRQSGDVTLLDCEGRLTFGEGTTLLRDTIRNLVADGKKNLVADFGKLEYIDDRGIRELVAGAGIACNHGGDLRLLNVKNRVQFLIEKTKLLSSFKAFDNEPAAVQSFVTEPGGGWQRDEPIRSR